jgi:hypothetical protein
MYVLWLKDCPEPEGNMMSIPLINAKGDVCDIFSEVYLTKGVFLLIPDDHVLVVEIIEVDGNFRGGIAKSCEIDYVDEDILIILEDTRNRPSDVFRLHIKEKISLFFPKKPILTIA